LEFDPDGVPKNGMALLEVMMPIILDVPPWGEVCEATLKARIAAAAALRTMAVVSAEYLECVAPEQRQFVVPLFSNGATCPVAPQFRMVEIADVPDVAAIGAQLRTPPFSPPLQGGERGGAPLVAVRLPLSPDSSPRVLDLYSAGVRTIHLCADFHGREQNPKSQGTRFIKDVLREVHGRLVKQGVRDEVTLIASGGIALAEHMAKAVICGADLVGIDLPLLVALGCQVCTHGRSNGCSANRQWCSTLPDIGIRPRGALARCSGCPVRVGRSEIPYAAQRMVNLMGAWHSQLIEVLGAMGIREVRRLRGEVGRAMFLEDLERDAFKELARSTNEAS
jgi:hypothetical protein